MIITDQVENRPTLSSAITDTNQFTIKNSAKAFHILSTSLYSDTKLAILRELGCNARDSHVEAGQTKPWRLHLPTLVNPMLEIEDYGVGLDHDQVMNMFTTFFESTKTDSNEFVGALGLGSKSPFSYTDNFTVITIKNGVRNVYSAYKTDAGVPAIARMHTEQTDAGNGVLIQIAAKTQDFNDFEQKARQALAFFDQLPTCNKNLAKAMLKPFAPFGTDLGAEQATGYTSPSVVMGGIAYRIESSRKEFQQYGTLLSHKIILRANIGDVEMTPSREGLTYNKQTTDWIVSRLEDLTHKIQIELEKKVAEYTSKWELAKFLVGQNENYSLYSAAVERLIKIHFPDGIPKLTFEEAELRQYDIRMSKYVQKVSGYGKTKPNLQPTAFGLSASDMSQSSYRFRGKRYNFMFDDSKVRVMDMLNCNIDGDVYLFQSKNPAAEEFIKKKLSETEFSLMYTSAHVNKVASQKREKIDFYKFDVVEIGGYHTRRKILKAIRCSGSVPAAAMFWVQMRGSNIDADVLLGTNLLNQDLIQFIEKHPNKVVGFSKTSKSPKGKLIDLTKHLQGVFDKEVARIKTPEGLEEAVIQQWSKFGYDNIPDLSDADIALLDDKTLAKMATIKKSKSETFLFLSRIKNLVPTFEVKHTEIFSHLQKHYSVINFNSDYKYKVALMNFIFNSK
jgi:hypothetical protein